MSSIAIPTPSAGDGLLFVSSGYVGDKLRPIYAVRPGATGDISLKTGETGNQFIAWSNPLAGPYNPSPLFYQDRVYVLYDRGLVTCLNAATGAVLYDRERLPEGFAFTASPWAGRGRVFALTKMGSVMCFAPAISSSCSTRTNLRTMTCAWPLRPWSEIECSSAPRRGFIAYEQASPPWIKRGGRVHGIPPRVTIHIGIEKGPQSDSFTD